MKNLLKPNSENVNQMKTALSEEVAVNINPPKESSFTKIPISQATPKPTKKPNKFWKIFATSGLVLVLILVLVCSI